MSIVPQLLVNSFIAAGTYALIAMGFNLIYGATKFFNLAHGAMAAVAGYLLFWLTGQFTGVPMLIAVMIGVAGAGVVGVALNGIVFAPLRKRKASNMVLLVASLGAFTVIQAAIAMIFTSQFQSIPSSTSDVIFQMFGAAITGTQIIILCSAVGVFVLVSLLLKFSFFGKMVRAVSDDEEVAKIAGINTESVIAWTFFIGSAVAGIGGVLIALDTGIQPTIGLQLFLKGVIASIVGGVGSVNGALLGAVLLGLAENFGIWKISGEWKDAIAFGLLIVFLIFRPKGILNK
jgi:branched-chain amino acid transport system permease protein